MIGVVGGGQLARMLVEAARSREIPVSVQTASMSRRMAVTSAGVKTLGRCRCPKAWNCATCSLDSAAITPRGAAGLPAR